MGAPLRRALVAGPPVLAAQTHAAGGPESTPATVPGAAVLREAHVREGINTDEKMAPQKQTSPPEAGHTIFRRREKKKILLALVSTAIARHIPYDRQRNNANIDFFLVGLVSLVGRHQTSLADLLCHVLDACLSAR